MLVCSLPSHSFINNAWRWFNHILFLNSFLPNLINPLNFVEIPSFQVLLLNNGVSLVSFKLEPIGISL